MWQGGLPSYFIFKMEMIKTLAMHNNDTTPMYIGWGPHIREVIPVHHMYNKCTTPLSHGWAP
jgi:hypothetical protein